MAPHLFFFLVFFVSFFFIPSSSLGSPAVTTFELTSWNLRSSASPTSYHVVAPATVLAGLVQNNVYPDPFYGENLLSIPTDIFDVPWIYSTNFTLDESMQGRTITLKFRGLNYRANVTLNGIAVAEDLVGTFRYFDLNVTGACNRFGPASPNLLEVSIIRPQDRSLPPNNNDTDLAISFVDWAPSPPDSNMGIWREVYVSVTGPFTLAYPMVSTQLSGDVAEGDYTAQLTVFFELGNSAAVANYATVQLSIPELQVSCSMNYLVFANSNITGHINSSLCGALVLTNPPLWWPWQMGEPTMWNLTLSVVDSQSVLSDTLTTQFGIRTVSSTLEETGRLFFVNGQRILIRGAGWAPDLFLRASPTRQQQEFTYIRDMNLNAVRLEGKMENDNFFALADQMGLLVMPGWCCCDAWQHWPLWGPEQNFVASESLRTQLKRLRIHPSVLVFLYGSDESPPPAVEQIYLDVVQQTNWSIPVLASAANTTSPITGNTGVKMSGPYTWVPPVYWYYEKLGGAFSFITETSPGGSPMTYEVLQTIIPSNKEWPVNGYWDFHCGSEEGLFGNLKYYQPEQDARYGESFSAAEFLGKAQAMTYEAHRAMFEAYGRNKYIASTGIIQWMLNNAWGPAMYWNLYGYLLNQGGAYYGAKKALEPIHVQYSPFDSSVSVINSYYVLFSNLEVVATILDSESKVVSVKTASIPALPADSSSYAMVVDVPHNISEVYFVHLVLSFVSNDSSPNVPGNPYFPALPGNTIVSENTYWLSRSLDVLEWGKSNFYNTPCKSYANYRPLNSMHKVVLSATQNTTAGTGLQFLTTVTVSNPTPYIAFLVRLRLLYPSNSSSSRGIEDQMDVGGFSRGNVYVVSGEQAPSPGFNDILPILWEDNFFTLLPNSARVVRAAYNVSAGSNFSLESGFEPLLVVEQYRDVTS